MKLYSMISLALLVTSAQSADERLRPFDLAQVTGSEPQQRQTLCAALTQLGETSPFSSKTPSKHLRQLVEARNAAILGQAGQAGQDADLIVAQGKIDRKRDKLQASRAALDALQTEQTDLRRNHETQTQELEHQREEHRQVQEDLRLQLNYRQAELRQTTDTLQTRETELTQAGIRHAEHTQTLQDQVTQLKAERDEETRQYETLLARNVASNDQLESVSADLDRMRSLHVARQDQQQQEFFTLTTNLMIAEDKRGRLTQELSEAKGIITAQDITIETLRARIQQLEDAAALFANTQSSAPLSSPQPSQSASSPPPAPSAPPPPAPPAPTTPDTAGRRHAYAAMPPAPSGVNLRPVPSSSSSVQAANPQAIPYFMSELKDKATSRKELGEGDVEGRLAENKANTDPLPEAPSILSEISNRKSNGQKPKFSSDEIDLVQKINAEITMGSFTPLFTAVKAKKRPEDKGMADVLLDAMKGRRINLENSDDESSDSGDWSDDDSKPTPQAAAAAATSSKSDIPEDVDPDHELKSTLRKVRHIYRLALDIDLYKKWTSDHWLIWEYQNYKTDAQKIDIDGRVDRYITQNKDALSTMYAGINFESIQSNYRTGIHHVQLEDMMASVVMSSTTK